MRRLWRVLLVLAVLAGVAGVGAALVMDALLVRTAVTRAEAAALDGRDLVTQGEIDAARDKLRDARRELSRATLRTNRLLWRTAERVPLAGASFTTLRGVVEIVDQGSGLGSAALDAAAPLIGANGDILIQPVDGQLPVQVMDAVGAAASALDPTALRAALDRLRAVRGPVPGIIAEGRDRVLEVGDEVARTLEVAAPVLEAVPTFLGAEGRRQYLLGMQNPAELRGTGGLLGFLAVLTADDGRLTISRPQAYSAFDALGREEDGALPPVEAPVEFARRYADQNAAGFLGNVNVDPDLPTTGPVLLDLVEDRTGLSFDGLLLVDPLAVAHVIREISPVTVDSEIAATAPELPDVVTADLFAELVMVEHYAVFEGRQAERRAWLSDVATRAFESIFDAEWDGAAVTKAVLEAAGGGHVALYLRDEAQQEAFVTADLAGALEPPTRVQAGDVLAATANNSAGNKMDRHVVHTLVGRISLEGNPASGEVMRRAELEVTVDNPVRPGDFGLYVEGSFPVSQGTRTPRAEERALARTWWSVWAPPHHSVVLDSPGGAQDHSWLIHGHRVADALLETPTQTADSFMAVVEGDVATPPHGSSRLYVLNLRRQPKAIADRLDVTISPPDGWRVVAGTTRGGDAAVGIPAQAPVVELGDDAVRITGMVTSDLTIEIQLARG